MINFIISHLNDLWVVISSIITGASAISAITPTKKDDSLVAEFQKLMNVLALNIGNAKHA